MGQAKNRGNREDRINQAKQKQADEYEKIRIARLERDKALIIAESKMSAEEREMLRKTRNALSTLGTIYGVAAVMAVNNQLIIKGNKS